jgi:thioredoxin-like negative regulator of GroEL
VILLDPGDGCKGGLPEIDQETLKHMIDEDTADAELYLEAAIHYLAATNRDEAYKLASSIVRKGDGRMRHGRVREALLYLLNCRSDETEQLLVDFYLNHDEHDENWHLANTYWKDN